MVDEIAGKLSGMDLSQLKRQKRLWEERICNDKVDSPLQAPRIKILRSISKEIDSRRC